MAYNETNQPLKRRLAMLEKIKNTVQNPDFQKAALEVAATIAIVIVIKVVAAAASAAILNVMDNNSSEELTTDGEIQE
jgi:hypothetical protein